MAVMAVREEAAPQAQVVGVLVAEALAPVEGAWARGED